MITELRNAFVCLIVLTLITGVAYPLVVTGVAQALFSNKASGSLLPAKAGSDLIGQPFDAPGYFWGRRSATGPTPYNAAASSGSNYAMTNPALTDAVKARIAALTAAAAGADGTMPALPIPVDLVTASGSGLDPHISPAAAEYQELRVAKARGMTPDKVRQVVLACTDQPTLGLIGEPVVNVLRLNLALDGKLAPALAAGDHSVGWRAAGFLPEK